MKHWGKRRQNISSQPELVAQMLARPEAAGVDSDSETTGPRMVELDRSTVQRLNRSVRPVRTRIY